METQHNTHGTHKQTKHWCSLGYIQTSHWKIMSWICQNTWSCWPNKIILKTNPKTQKGNVFMPLLQNIFFSARSLIFSRNSHVCLIWFVHTSSTVFVSLSLCLSVSLSLSVSLCLSLSLCLSVTLSLCLSVSLSLCLYLYLYLKWNFFVRFQNVNSKVELRYKTKTPNIKQNENKSFENSIEKFLELSKIMLFCIGKRKLKPNLLN